MTSRPLTVMTGFCGLWIWRSRLYRPLACRSSSWVRSTWRSLMSLMGSLRALPSRTRVAAKRELRHSIPGSRRRLDRGRVRLAELLPRPRHQARRDRQQHHQDDYLLDVVLHLEVIAEERLEHRVEHRRQGVAEQDHARHPADAAEDVEEHEPAVVHPADASDHWGEGADDRHEPGQHYRLAAVPLVEGLGRQQVVLAEPERLLTGEDLRPGLEADPVADAVTDDRRDAQCHEEQWHVPAGVVRYQSGG